MTTSTIRLSNPRLKEAEIALDVLDQIAQRALRLRKERRTQVEGERLHEFGRQLAAAWLPKLELDRQQLHRLVARQETLQKAWPGVLQQPCS